MHFPQKQVPIKRNLLVMVLSGFVVDSLPKHRTRALWFMTYSSAEQLRIQILLGTILTVGSLMTLVLIL